MDWKEDFNKETLISISSDEPEWLAFETSKTAIFYKQIRKKTKKDE
jgi:hypothetical protein